MVEKRTFRYHAVDAGGKDINDTIDAPNELKALQQLENAGLVVTRLDLRGSGQARLFGRPKKITNTEKILLLRQFAIMSRAGVELLEAVETTSKAMRSEEGRRATQAAAAALRRGDRVGEAFRNTMPFFPDYVYSLIDVGEHSGRLDKVLSDSAKQLEAEDKIRKNVQTALTYPLFLLSAGLLVVFFLFYEVVPRFSSMIGDEMDNLSGLSGFVIGAGLALRENILVFGLTIGAIGTGIVYLIRSRKIRMAIYDFASDWPVVGDLIAARERAAWARLMEMALANGVPLMTAAALAQEAAPEGRLRRAVTAAAKSLRAGRRVDEALEREGVLEEIDIGLLRTGAKAGDLAPMFEFIAERYEEKVAHATKRVTSLIEPIAILLVASMVGVVALALITAMSSIYEAVL